MPKPKTITLHNTPQFYVEYMKNWLATTKTVSPAEKMIIQDLTTLVEIGADHLKAQPEPAEPETTS